MIVVTSATAPTPDAEVDPRFGRAAHFIAMDTDTGAWTAHENSQNLNAVQGAGIQAAETAARLGAEAVITGHCGPKAFRTLAAAGIAVVTGASGTVRGAVAAYKSVVLAPTNAPDVKGHWE